MQTDIKLFLMTFWSFDIVSALCKNVQKERFGVLFGLIRKYSRTACDSLSWFEASILVQLKIYLDLQNGII